MYYSSYLNNRELHAAAARYESLYGGRFICSDFDDLLVYQDREGVKRIPLDDRYTIPFLIKRLRQASQHTYTVDPLTLLWPPVTQQELRDLAGLPAPPSSAHARI